MNALSDIANKQKLICESSIEDISSYEIFNEFLFFHRKDNDKNKEIEDTESQENIEKKKKHDELMRKTVQKIAKETAKPCVQLFTEEVKSVNFDDSFMCGKPGYLPKDFKLNKDEWVFLSQINCKELTHLPEFPHTGILSFWVNCDNVNDGKCFYFDDISKPKMDDNELNEFNNDKIHYDWMADDGLEIDVNVINKYEFKNSTDNILSSNFRGRDTFVKTYNEFADEIGIEHVSEYEYEELITVLKELHIDYWTSDKCGGYDDPIQIESFVTSDDTNDSTLILQIDTIDPVLKWGDYGNAQFYISNDDLKKLNFDKTKFYWSCM